MNRGVGVIEGFYEKGIPICIISSLALDMLEYQEFEEYKRGTDEKTRACLKNHSDKL